MFEILTKTLTNDVVSFEQPSPGRYIFKSIVGEKTAFFALIFRGKILAHLT